MRILPHLYRGNLAEPYIELSPHITGAPWNINSTISKDGYGDGDSRNSFESFDFDVAADVSKRLITKLLVDS